jgi:Undecaprenyl-phosphate glucose phosphotransferase
LVRWRTEFGYAQTLSERAANLRDMIPNEAIPGTFGTASVQRAPMRSMFSRSWTELASDLLPLCDLLSLFLVASFGTALYAVWPTAADLAFGFEKSFEHKALIAVVLAPFILYDKRFGAIASLGQMSRLVRSHLFRFTIFAGLMLLLGATSRSLNTFPLAWLIVCFAASLLLTSLTRVLIAVYVRRLQRHGALTEVIAIVGAGPLADRLVQSLRQTRPACIEVLGIFDDKIAGAVPSEIKSSGTLAKLIELGKTRKIDWILLTLPATAEDRLQSITQRLRTLSVPIALCPQHMGLKTPFRDLDFVGDGLPVSLLADQPIKRWDAVAKGVEDFLLGGIITLLLLPLLAIVAVAIKLSSPGPIIFRQRRHTVNNREFYIYKFRTMSWNPRAAGECLQQTARHDERVTHVGRFLRASSLDELPQLFNVLRGEMSLVGPRPHAVNMRTENQLGAEITDQYAHRHRVKPGITGWSQVNGARGATDTVAQLRRRVELDIHYIDNWSLLFDLKILALTSRVVIKHTNAY